MRLPVLLPLLVALLPSVASAARWPDLDPVEFTRTVGQIDPEAGVEILLREVIITHRLSDPSIVSHYIRARVYTESGVQRLSKIEIPARGGGTITGIEGRTVKPDGTSIELNRKEVFEREVLRTGNVRLLVKSFAPPALEPGVLFEYRFNEILDTVPGAQTFLYQGDLPTRLVRYKIKPAPAPFVALNILTFNAPQQKSARDSQGYYTYEVQNVPAAKEEPFQLPAFHIQPVSLAYYIHESERDRKDLWKKRGADLFTATEQEGKTTKALTAAVATLVAPGDSEETRLRKLFDFCRATIVHRNRDTSGLTREQRAKLPVNDNATDTLKNRSGHARDIDTLFLALARAAGFDARFAWSNDRSRMLYLPDLREPFLLPERVVAVQLAGKWQFFNPSKRYLPFATLDWQNSDAHILVAAPTDATVQPSPGLPANATTRLRTGHFTLSADGTLEGDVTLTYTGYWESEQKELLDALSVAERTKRLTTQVQDTHKLAEVTDVVVENADLPLAPLAIRYHVRIPEFAERTGSRLFLPLAVFHKGVPPLFEATTRKSDVLFRHRYTERDEFTFQPPAGFTLEAASAPAELLMGTLATYTAKVTVSRSTGEIGYKRAFSLNTLFLSVAKYPALKQAFDLVHGRDSHLLTLKRDTPAGDPAANTAPSAEDAPSASPASPAFPTATPGTPASPATADAPVPSR